MRKVKYKPNTAIFAMHQIMKKALEAGKEIEISGIKTRKGPAGRSTISMHMSQITKNNDFPGVYFYTRTKLDGTLVVGVRND